MVMLISLPLSNSGTFCNKLAATCCKLGLRRKDIPSALHRSLRTLTMHHEVAVVCVKESNANSKELISRRDKSH